MAKIRGKGTHVEQQNTPTAIYMEMRELSEFYRVPMEIMEAQYNGTVEVPRLSDEQRNALREEWRNVYCTGNGE